MKRVFNLQKGFAVLFHEVSRAALPLVAFGFVVSDLATIAMLSVFLFKWRILAVKTRFWAANIRANMVDILVGLSFIEFMSDTDSLLVQVGWLTAYIVWVVYVKKLSSKAGRIFQGLASYVLSMSALALHFATLQFGLVLLGAWVVAYFCSRHILATYKESHAAALAHTWAVIVVGLTWVLWHWQVHYWFVNQLVLITGVGLTGFSVAYSLTRKEEGEEVNTSMIKQVLFSTGLMMVAIVILHRWSADAIVGL